MIALKPTNVLITTGDITKNVTLVMTFHKPAGEEIRMYGLDTSLWKLSNTPEEKFQDQLTLIQ